MENIGRRGFLSLCGLGLMDVSLHAHGEAPPKGYTKEPFPEGGIELDVWRKGNGGPVVFVLHDMLGLRKACFDLGDQLVSEGFSVAIPRFFGGFGGGVLGYLKACEGSPDFRCFDHDDPGPIGAWVKALAERGSGTGKFGAIGNCMTGIMPLLMLRTERCVAPILCQPAFPFNSYFAGRAYKAALNIPRADLDFAAARSARDDVAVLGIRYQIDKLCGPERFCTLQRAFGERFHCLVLPDKGHTTLLGHQSPEAYKKAVGFLKHRLQNAAWNDAVPPCVSSCP